MAKKKRLNLKKFIPFCLICTLILLGAAFGISKLLNREPVIDKCSHEYVNGVCTKCGEADPDYVKPDEIINVSMVCGGDIMYHESQLKAAYNYDGKSKSPGNGDFTAESGTFTFDREYKYIKSYVETADVAFVNLETTLAGGPDYSGSWYRFNTPDNLADTLKDTGFDVIFTSNNHSLDRKLDGLKRTVEVLEGVGLTSVGSRKSTDQTRSKVIDVNGVKIGVVSYTYETAESNGKRTLNGSIKEDNFWAYLNTFRFGADGLALDEDKKAMADEISWCKNNGAEVIVCYLHWDSTNEYVKKPTALQKDLARYLAENGADIIFGSHPHLIQAIEEISIGDKIVPVYYSLGNFISNQRRESLYVEGSTYYEETDEGSRATEQELLAYIQFSYNKTKKELTINTAKAIPLWVDRYSNGTYYEYRIIPLCEGFEELEDLQTSGHVERAKKGLENITKLIGEKYIYN